MRQGRKERTERTKCIKEKIKEGRKEGRKFIKEGRELLCMAVARKEKNVGRNKEGRTGGREEGREEIRNEGRK